MSPEQARGVTLDERTDLFSLGVVLYLLCTGKEPFAGPNATAVLTALAVDRQRPARELNPKVPEALSDLIDRLLEKNPADRPQSAAEVAKALRLIERGQASPAPLPTAEAEAPTFAMGQPTQAAAEPGRETEREPERPKPPRRTGARRKKKRKPARVAWLVAGFAGLIPVLIGGTWLIARDGRPADTKAPEVKPPTAKPATTAAATQTTAEPVGEPPVGFRPPPKKGFGPPPPGFGPGSPGFGPPPGAPGGPPLPFPPPKD
jgi:hypothetical protein